MHLYPAMGLIYQHTGQQMVLGRVRSTSVAAALAGAACNMWSLSEPIVRNVANDEKLWSKWMQASQELLHLEPQRRSGTRNRIAELTSEQMLSAFDFLQACVKDAPPHVQVAYANVKLEWSRANISP